MSSSFILNSCTVVLSAEDRIRIEPPPFNSCLFSVRLSSFKLPASTLALLAGEKLPAVIAVLLSGAVVNAHEVSPDSFPSLSLNNPFGIVTVYALFGVNCWFGPNLSS
ncbi:hypothetical protein D3C71_1711920 [compost metagenome]